MKKLSLLLLAVLLCLMLGCAAAESSEMTVETVISLARTYLPTEGDFLMDFSYDKANDIVMFTVNMNFADFETINTLMESAGDSYKTAVDSCLDLNKVLKELLEASGFDQNVLGIMYASDGIVCEIFLNGTLITSLYY